jgi:hypothetical protein
MQKGILASVPAPLAYIMAAIMFALSGVAVALTGALS